MPYLPSILYVPYLPDLPVHRITLLCIGSLKFLWAKSACGEFTERLQRAVSLNIIELPASSEKDADRQRSEESDRLRKALEKRRGTVWVLDEGGKGMTSQQFTKELQIARDRGEEMTFVLGGAYGLDDIVRSHADRLLCLSAMTLPHELCRVVFLEQLYRAIEIGKGSGYHH